MSFFTDIVKDLRQRRLWPVAAVLVLALIAVPVLLSSSAKTVPVAAQQSSAPPSPDTALPAVNVTSSEAKAKLTGSAHNPFAQQAQGAATSVTGTVSSAVSATSSSARTTGSSLGGSSSSSSSASSSSGSSSTSTGATGSPSAPAPKVVSQAPAPGPSLPGTGSHASHPSSHTLTLTPTESFRVALSITNANGGFDTIDPLERLSVLPSAGQPLLVELGVLKGGHRVLFVVQRGAVLSGPGTCTPGPVDCEILSLGEGQTEGLGIQGSSGVTSVAEFAVTGIGVQKHPSIGAANQARLAESGAGRQLLAASKPSALSLFEYKPSLGAVVDLRDLTVGIS